MLKLKKTIDFNLLGDDESEAVRGEDPGAVMDLDDDLSEETSPSPPPLKLARIKVSSSSPEVARAEGTEPGAASLSSSSWPNLAAWDSTIEKFPAQNLPFKYCAQKWMPNEGILYLILT